LGAKTIVKYPKLTVYHCNTLSYNLMINLQN
jgi:hypothetical protein